MTAIRSTKSRTLRTTVDESTTVAILKQVSVLASKVFGRLGTLDVAYTLGSQVNRETRNRCKWSDSLPEKYRSVQLDAMCHRRETQSFLPRLHTEFSAVIIVVEYGLKIE